MKYKNYKLKQLIECSRMTQSEVARKAGLSSESKLSRLINLSRKPTVEELTSLAKVLNVCIDELGFTERGA